MSKPLPRKTFSVPADIAQFMARIKRRNKHRSLQAAFESCMRIGIASMATDINMP